jgi:hypothetical protein
LEMSSLLDSADLFQRLLDLMSWESRKSVLKATLGKLSSCSEQIYNTSELVFMSFQYELGKWMLFNQLIINGNWPAFPKALKANLPLLPSFTLLSNQKKHVDLAGDY